MAESHPAEPIGPGQFFWLHAASMVAGGVYLWPGPLLAAAGPDAWWAFLVTVLGVAGVTYLRFAWIGYLRSASLPDLLMRTWGRALTWVLLTGITVVALASAAMLLALFGQMLQTFFYPLTPIGVLEGVTLAEAYLLSRQSLAVMARNVTFWLPLVMGSALFLIILAARNVQDTAALAPAWPPGTEPVLTGVAWTWFLWMQCEVSAALVPHVRGASLARLRWLAIGSELFEGLLLGLLLASVLGDLGPQAARALRWPTVYLFSNLTIHTFFITRVGVFVLFAWVVSMVTFLAMYLFLFGWHWQLQLGLDNHGRRVLTGGLGAALLAAAVLLDRDHLVVLLLTRVVSPLCLVMTGLLVPASLLRTAWRARRGAVPA
ncbi:MAG: GerAB/ArcD/ProY family transporter [Firmicutes bacterium]|nr:GerAB/ArcD/ProY family transporter [Bacillota bacterium]